MAVRIQEIGFGRERKQFITFPWRIYGGDPNWVPPLIVDRRDFLNPKKNPFFEHATVRLFLARDESGRPLGRIAGIINGNHLAAHKDHTGFFGLFECVNDPAVAGRLLGRVVDMLREAGLRTMRGPMNMSVNDDIGLLIDGFDRPPAVMMPYNPPYYADLFERFGLRKRMDLLAYYLEQKDGRIPERLVRGAEAMRRRYGITVRPLDMKKFKSDAATIHRVYSEAWADNWGAVAMTEREFAHLAADLKMVVDPGFCLLAFVKDEPAGFSLALPDINQALIKLDGRLLPLGLPKLLWYKRKIDMVRIITMGVPARFRGKGIDTCFYYETYRHGMEKGIYRGELSWVLETNGPMNNALRKLGARVYKKYRLYDYSL